MHRALIAVLLLSAAAFAQTPAAPPDTSKEALVFEKLAERVVFHDDGTGEVETTVAARVQSEAALKEVGQLIFGYSSATENLEIGYVRVRKPSGEIVNTPPEGVQDLAPEVLRAVPMYGDYRQKHVSVSGIRPGDVLEYRTIEHITKPLIPGQFWYQYTFPEDVAVLSGEFEVVVPKGRNIHLKSPERKYDTAAGGDTTVYTWKVAGLVPKHDTGSETAAARRKKKSADEPDIQLSTFSDWQQLARWYAELQGPQVVVDAAVQKKADELVRGATTTEEKVRRLYAFVSGSIRYVSLSFGIGRFQPHPAPEILQNAYGDCKDKHTLLAALLKAEGIESYPVLIHSQRKLDPDVVSPAQFDHLITVVKLGPDKLTWLDSTPEVGPYGLLLYKLRNKQALLASTDSNGGLRTSPADAPLPNRQAFLLDGSLSENGTLEAGVDMSFQGDAAVVMRSLFRQVAEADWPRVAHLMSQAMGFAGDVTEVKLEGLDRLEQPLHLRYHYHRDDYISVPAAGLARTLPLPPLSIPEYDEEVDKDAIDIGPPGEIDYKAHLLLPANMKLSVPINLRITRDYAEYAATYDLKGKTLDVNRHLTIKGTELPLARRSDLSSFVTVARNDEGQTATIDAAATAAASQPARPKITTDDPDALREAANGAMARRDYQGAIDLYKRLVDKDPKDQEGWDDLGRAYAAARDHQNAISAFRKQIEVNPYSQTAYDGLGEELQLAGQNEEAMAAYRKQLEINPLDGTAHKDLGFLLMAKKQSREAQTELETADKIHPNDPQVRMALVALYQQTGDKEKANLMLSSIVGGAAPASSDLYSLALVDNLDPVKTVHEADDMVQNVVDGFASGDYDIGKPDAFAAMNFLALAWARIGWAKSAEGNDLEALRFLTASFSLSQSGTVANRIGRIYEKQGQKEKAAHMFALAICAGGADVADSRARLAKLSTPQVAATAINNAGAELSQLRTVKLPAFARSAEADFDLLFDGSSHPDRIEFVKGDEALRGKIDALMQVRYPVEFPDASDVKIVRRGILNCGIAGCRMVLEPIEAVAAPAASSLGPTPR